FERIGLTIIRALNLVIVKTKESLHYAIDSYHAPKHYEKRIDRKHKLYLKLSITGQTQKPFLIEDFAITDKHCHDTKHIRPIIKRFKRINKIIFADKGYDEKLHLNVKENGNYLHCPLREMSKNPKGFLRRKTNKIFKTEIYNERNKIETMFLIKNTGIVIRSKKRNNKIKELAWKILSYNIERLTKFLQKLWLIIIS
ncbi:MAG: transposase, partial [Candidatus Woesearchaeota archaeon]